VDAQGEHKLSEEALDEQPHYASLISTVRFGPGALTILVLITLTTIVFYISGLQDFAIVSGATGVVMFCVKSMEIIRLSHPEKRQLIGKRCYVVKRVERGRMGIVRVYRQNDRLEPELWSAESRHTIAEGQTAEVVQVRSVVLLVKPVEPNQIWKARTSIQDN